MTTNRFAYNFMVRGFGVSLCTDESEQDYNIHHTRKEFNALAQEIKILHFCTDKPWVRLISYTYKGQFIAELWWEYARKTPVFCEILNKQRENLSKDTRAHQIGFLVLQAKDFGDSSSSLLC